MRRTKFRFHILVISLLVLFTPHAHADDTVFDPPKEGAVVYAPERYVDALKLLPVEINGQWGYADPTGAIVIEPSYEWADYFYGPFKYKSRRFWIARFKTQEKMSWLLLPESTQPRSSLIKCDRLHVVNTGTGFSDRFQEGYAITERGAADQQRYNLMMRDGVGLVDDPFEGALRMTNGLSAVQIDGLCGFIDKRGKFMIPLRFAEVRSFHDGLAAVRQPEAQGGMWGYIDKSGKHRFIDRSGEIQELRSYHEDLAAVKARDKWGFLDRRRKIHIKPIYDEVRDFADGNAAVRRGAAWGYIDTTGKEFAWGFDGAWEFETDLKSGLTDGASSVHTVSLGLVRQGDTYGYVNKAGDFEIEPRYSNAMPFFRGTARVKCGNSFAYIERSEQLVWDPRRVSLHGVRNLKLPEPVEPKWPGLPQPNGAWGEPFPFEYDVEDHLPSQRPRTHAQWELLQNKNPETPDDKQDTPIQAEAPKDTRRGHNR